MGYERKHAVTDTRTTAALDLNLAVVCGRLATPAELRQFDSGARLIRVLITVRQETPRRRVDVIPATLWDPPEDLAAAVAEGIPRGTRVWVAGSIQRRYWENPDGRRSRIELVAEQMTFKDPEGVGQ